MGLRKRTRIDQLLKTTLAAHLDPAKQHLDFSSGPFLMPGQPGEGMIALSLRRSPYKCGAYTRPN